MLDPGGANMGIALIKGILPFLDKQILIQDPGGDYGSYESAAAFMSVSVVLGPFSEESALFRLNGNCV